jgi:RNA polymerase sigma-70 factor, ECF subfamily
LAPSGSVTGLLHAWRAGDEAALERLTPLVYQELRRIARRSLRREREGHSLQATALVHEAYMRLVDARHVDWHDRVHFFSMAARLMRRVLVDHARARHRRKRGGGAAPLPLTDARVGSLGKGEDLLALDDALRALATLDLRKSRVVELRFFGGLSVAETAAALSVSADTVMRDWKLARAWLRRELGASETRDA